MYVSSAKDAAGWKRYFEIAKTLGMEFSGVRTRSLLIGNILDSLGEIYKIKQPSMNMQKEAAGTGILILCWLPSKAIKTLGLCRPGALGA
jgi:hypothetical protein